MWASRCEEGRVKVAGEEVHQGPGRWRPGLRGAPEDKGIGAAEEGLWESGLHSTRRGGCGGV